MTEKPALAFLFGSVATVREGVEPWRAPAVTTPVLAPSLIRDGEAKRVAQMSTTFA